MWKIEGCFIWNGSILTEKTGLNITVLYLQSVSVSVKLTVNADTTKPIFLGLYRIQMLLYFPILLHVNETTLNGTAK